MSEAERRSPVATWACPHCGVVGRPLAPSGRCAGCEAAVPPGAVSGPTYFIGDVADATGLSLRSLRYYEEAGLVLPAGRTSGGFRIYTDDAVARVRLIMQMKPLGFTLEEMRILLGALDAVRSNTDGPSGRATIAMFSALANERCRHLREQLVIAEAFSEQLKIESAQPEGR